MHAKRGFTLSEVLITLGIIGVVAALTIPGLYSSYQAKLLSVKLKKIYSTMIQTTAQVIEQEYEGDESMIDSVPSSQLQNAYMKYINAFNKCKADSNCGATVYPKGQNRSFASFVQSNYKTYTGNSIYAGCISDTALVLNDETFIIFDNCGDNGKIITIDINGWKKKPNKLGHDFFMFQIIDGKFIPMGRQGTAYTQCSSTSTGSSNGRGCTDKALKDDNYFKNLPK